MNTSKGEQKIINILKSVGVSFHREFTFKDLKSLKHKPLRFDFAIFNAYNQITIIEYDGQQHFQFDKHFSKSEQDFKYRQESDLKKNEYCLAHGIPLYRIPYYDFEKLNSIVDLFQPQYLVQNKWHNHNIRHELQKQGLVN